jgi:hypothetical protein
MHSNLESPQLLRLRPLLSWLFCTWNLAAGPTQAMIAYACICMHMHVYAMYLLVDAKVHISWSIWILQNASYNQRLQGITYGALHFVLPKHFVESCALLFFSQIQVGPRWSYKMPPTRRA